MPAKFARLVVITAFGRNSARPLPSGLQRLAGAYLLAVAVGLLTAKAASHMALPSDLPTAFCLSFLATCSFIAMGLIVFMLKPGWEGADNRLSVQLSVLPIEASHRAIVQLMPYGLIWLIVVLFSIPLVAELGNSMRVPVGLALLGIASSSLAAIGLGFIKRLPVPALRILLFILISSFCIFVLDRVARGSNPNLSLLVFAPMAVLYLGFVQNYKFSAPTSGIFRFVRPMLRLPKQFLNQFWFLLKLARSRRALNSFLFCTVASTITAIVLYKRGIISSSNSVGWLVFGALLSAAFACDVRGLSRRYKAPEIAALKDLNFFVKSQAQAVLLGAIIISLPILIVVAISGQVSAYDYPIYYLGIQAFAAMIGLLASTLFVPEPGDIGPQFFAAITAVASLFALPKLSGFSDYGPQRQGICWGLAAIFCGLGILLIEKHRRRNYGRA